MRSDKQNSHQIQWVVHEMERKKEIATTTTEALGRTGTFLRVISVHLGSEQDKKVQRV